MNRNLQKRIDRINEQLESLNEEKQALLEDLSLIKGSVKAASKMACGELTTWEDDRIFWKLKDDYPAFFDSEGEQEGASSNLNKLKAVKHYIKQELKTNNSNVLHLHEKANKLFQEDQQSSSSKHRVEKEKPSIKPSDLVEKGESSIKPEYLVERGESSIRPEHLVEKGKSSIRPEHLVEKGESSKRKADYISDSDQSSVSSKKSRQSPSDYIDSLPELPYNPFDDWSD